MLLGLLLSMLSALYLVVVTFEISFSSDELIAVTMGVVGLTTSILSVFVLSWRKQQDTETINRMRKYAAVEALQEAWIRFEGVYSSFGLPDRQNDTRLSFHAMLAQLKSKNIISSKDIEVLREALILRNASVHGSEAVSTDDLIRVNFELETITDRLLMERLN
ncbi:hypothetical protein RDV64_15625 [Acuticoccus sp. MNP-M23]|uniref:hypothetical protein n=1 Tax=Acuticoccus sp. MNP-M23 TaxID=3072793 RepID=UPI002814B893|nr:hypothetical protein [Acuticoccus sp. MNP-M23]WMS41501.1 hypothetical protein RDV64_15625 [Acuticoccus sp. MNP-M23]